jgi:mRNA interferase MazF
MKHGKIVLTPFPFTDLTRNKVRPAVIVSSSLTNSKDVILAFISTVFDDSNLSPTDELLLATDTDFAVAGLKKSSVFKMDKLATIERSILLGEIGEVSADLQIRLNKKLKIALNLK